MKNIDSLLKEHDNKLELRVTWTEVNDGIVTTELFELFLLFNE